MTTDHNQTSENYKENTWKEPKKNNVLLRGECVFHPRNYGGHKWWGVLSAEATEINPEFYIQPKKKKKKKPKVEQSHFQAKEKAENSQPADLYWIIVNGSSLDRSEMIPEEIFLHQ